MRTSAAVIASLSMLVACVPSAPQATMPPTATTPAAGMAAPVKPVPLDTTRLEALTNAKGKLDEKSGVFKVSVPRTDLTVTVASTIKMSPPMGLAAWAAFQPVGAAAMVMGDIVVTEDQVNPVMSAALDAGLDVTALHNHFFWDSPKVMFMHIAGMGDPAALATAVGKVFATMKSTAGGKVPIPSADIDPAKSTLDPAKLDAILGTDRDFKDGVYKIVFGRTARMGGVEVGGAMGVNTWAAFAGSDDVAVVDGDFAMLESEVRGVLTTLRHAGIQIVALHHHMLGEQPRIIYTHYWGIGRSVDLARAIKAALDTQAKSLGQPAAPPVPAR